jgi:hypothetical protein
MPSYHLSCLRQGRRVGTVDVEAENDEEAIRLARARVDCDTVEVRSSDRGRLSSGPARWASLDPVA